MQILSNMFDQNIDG